MIKVRKSASEIGIKEIEWRFHFIPQGSSVKHRVRDTLYLDVGNDLTYGIIDQHHDASSSISVAEFVYTYPEYVYTHLLGRWLDLFDEGKALPSKHTINIVTHISPDFDGLASIWLTLKLIEDGEFPPVAAALVPYVSLVDQGKYKIINDDETSATHPLHMAYLAIQNLTPPSGINRDEWCLSRGLELLNNLSQKAGELNISRCALNMLLPSKGSSSSPNQNSNPLFGAWRELEGFQDVKSLLDEDSRLYWEYDYPNSIKENISLPTYDKDDVNREAIVRCLILKQPPRSKLNKYWVRSMDPPFPMFICPYNKPGSKESMDHKSFYPRVIISLDPTMPQGPVTLKGLGAALERAEVKYRNEHGGDNRLKTPRWADGSVTNADPWYDGRGHDFTIVDSPSSETLLPYDEILKICSGSFWKVPIQSAYLSIFYFKSSLDVGLFERPYACQDLASEINNPTAFSDKISSEESRLIKDFAINILNQEIDVIISKLNHSLYGNGVLLIDKLKNLIDSNSECLLVSVGGGDVMIHRIDIEFDEKYSYEDIVDIVSIVSSIRDFYVLAATTPLDRGPNSTRAQSLIQYVCVNGVEIQMIGAGDVVVFNDHVLASSGARLNNKDDMANVFMFACYQSEMLKLFYRDVKVVSSLSEARDLSNVNDIVNRYINFQVEYLHIDFTRSNSQHAMYIKMREILSIDSRHENLSEALNRLESLANEKTDRDTNVLLFFVGIMAVIDTCSNDYSHLGVYRELGTLTVVLGTIIIYFKINKLSIIEMILGIKSKSK